MPCKNSAKIETTLKCYANFNYSKESASLPNRFYRQMEKRELNISHFWIILASSCFEEKMSRIKLAAGLYSVTVIVNPLRCHSWTKHGT